MKKKLMGLFLLAGLLAASAVTAHAETYQGKSGWHVEFTKEQKMESNFSTKDLTEAAAGLQPGDSIRLTVSLENSYGKATDWYMRNDIRQSLEDASSTAAGGAYTYVLEYTDPDGKKTELFNSDTVGGEDVSQAGEGLNEATSALKDYFFLDNLGTGETGKVDLLVALEGETQGNDYQDTLAQLDLSFAVEVNDSGTTPGNSTRVNVVKTGDREIPIGPIVLMAAAGIVLLVFAIRNTREDRRDRKGAA